MWSIPAEGVTRRSLDTGISARVAPLRQSPYQLAVTPMFLIATSVGSAHVRGRSMNLRMQSLISVSRLVPAFATIAATLVAQAPAAHLETALPWSNGAVTNAAMDSRIHDGAARYRLYAPVPRYALYDMAYPKDSAEAAAMNGYAILVVTALVQDSTELPLAKVYVSDARGDLGLTLVNSTASRVSPAESDVRATFGQFRWDGIFLFPLSS